MTDAIRGQIAGKPQGNLTDIRNVPRVTSDQFSVRDFARGKGQDHVIVEKPQSATTKPQGA